LLPPRGSEKLFVGSLREIALRWAFVPEGSDGFAIALEGAMIDRGPVSCRFEDTFRRQCQALELCPDSDIFYEASANEEETEEEDPALPFDEA